jgi:hypothetical protein
MSAWRNGLGLDSCTGEKSGLLSREIDNGQSPERPSQAFIVSRRCAYFFSRSSDADD